MTFPMPPAPAGSAQQAMMAQYTYLYQLAGRLNLALEAAEEQRGALRTETAGKAGRAELREQYTGLKSLIIKSADTVRAEMNRITAELEGSYVAQSEFGTYVERLSSYLEANPAALTQYYKFAADLQAVVSRVDTDFRSWQSETEGYIRTGIVDYDGALPIYGVAVGQNLSVSEADGETRIDKRNFRATFTAQKLSFWQDETEIAYISNNQIHISSIDIEREMRFGAWQIAADGGLTIQWGD